MINILTGPVNSGKTTLLKNTLSSLNEKDLAIDGYLSEAVWEKNDFLGYDLYDLKDHRHHPFIRKKGQEEWQSIGPFFFQPESLDIAKHIIRRSGKADLCVVDEVGPLELEGKGVWPAIAKVLKLSQVDFLLVIRSSVLENFLARIKRSDTQVFSIEQKNIQTVLARSLLSDIKRRRRSR